MGSFPTRGTNFKIGEYNIKKHFTKEKGDLGVAKVFSDLVSKEYYVFFSISEHLPFDLISYKEGKFSRISVKYRNMNKGTISVKFASSYSDKNGTHITPINKNDVDIIAIYCPETDLCYYIDPKKFNKSISLRIENPINKVGTINYSIDYLEIPNLGENI